eukprot:CAMPEP_0177796232 /NCGR_PEP_ID=MMETSP0491_2-20121128/26671_2 /TAXON_ID=63592 /ORGANISM="Tetraselmis chuii, Strain PLY429" /LENGTH=65 /DNA_ID=CAMNT_0019319145 /DNA_START=636 /DNA_END=833 /DNA_ORIENTATION=-
MLLASRVWMHWHHALASWAVAPCEVRNTSQRKAVKQPDEGGSGERPTDEDSGVERVQEGAGAHVR